METGKENEIVLYQPNEMVKLEVRVQEDSVWLTQQQIADLFGTKRPAITKHIKNIYSSGELEESSTCSILELMGNDGKQMYSTKFYNLDAILSVGYRVNSINATAFRRWANQVLKENYRLFKCSWMHVLTNKATGFVYWKKKPISIQRK